MIGYPKRKELLNMTLEQIYANTDEWVKEMELEFELEQEDEDYEYE